MENKVTLLYELIKLQMYIVCTIISTKLIVHESVGLD